MPLSEEFRRNIRSENLAGIEAAWGGLSAEDKSAALLAAVEFGAAGSCDKIMKLTPQAEREALIHSNDDQSLKLAIRNRSVDIVQVMTHYVAPDRRSAFLRPRILSRTFIDNLVNLVTTIERISESTEDDFNNVVKIANSSKRDLAHFHFSEKKELPHDVIRIIHGHTNRLHGGSEDLLLFAKVLSEIAQRTRPEDKKDLYESAASLGVSPMEVDVTMLLKELLLAEKIFKQRKEISEKETVESEAGEESRSEDEQEDEKFREDEIEELTSKSVGESDSSREEEADKIAAATKRTAAPKKSLTLKRGKTTTLHDSLKSSPYAKDPRPAGMVKRSSSTASLAAAKPVKKPSGKGGKEK